MCKFTSANALCPFYKNESVDRREVVCEGVTDNSLLHLSFKSKPSADKYRECYCYCKNYKRCQIHNMLAAKYET